MIKAAWRYLLPIALVSLLPISACTSNSTVKASRPTVTSGSHPSTTASDDTTTTIDPAAISAAVLARLRVENGLAGATPGPLVPTAPTGGSSSTGSGHSTTPTQPKTDTTQAHQHNPPPPPPPTTTTEPAHPRRTTTTFDCVADPEFC